MFDIGFTELVLVFIVALLVVGPERLPRAARTVGLWVGRIKQTVNAIRVQVEHEVQLEEFKARMQQELEDSGVEDAGNRIAHALDEATAIAMEKSDMENRKILSREKQAEELPPSSHQDSAMPEEPAPSASVNSRPTNPS